MREQIIKDIEGIIKDQIFGNRERYSPLLKEDINITAKKIAKYIESIKLKDYAKSLGNRVPSELIGWEDLKLFYCDKLKLSEEKVARIIDLELTLSKNPDNIRADKWKSFIVILRENLTKAICNADNLWEER